jgi:hypothetical protein
MSGPDLLHLKYDFLRVGSVVEPRRGYVYVDIGNRLEPGVIDTHQRAGGSDPSAECTTSLIAREPWLVSDWGTPTCAQPCT